jgi:hypothetical protein
MKERKYEGASVLQAHRHFPSVFNILIFSLTIGQVDTGLAL